MSVFICIICFSRRIPDRDNTISLHHTIGIKTIIVVISDFFNAVFQNLTIFDITIASAGIRVNISPVIILQFGQRVIIVCPIIFAIERKITVPAWNAVNNSNLDSISLDQAGIGGSIGTVVAFFTIFCSRPAVYTECTARQGAVTITFRLCIAVIVDPEGAVIKHIAVVVKTIIDTMNFLDTIVALMTVFIKIALIVPAINQKRTVFLCPECVRSVIRSVITEFCIFDQITMFVEIVFFAVYLANFILVPDTVFISVTYITVIIGIPAGSKIVLG